MRAFQQRDADQAVAGAVDLDVLAVGGHAPARLIGDREIKNVAGRGGDIHGEARRALLREVLHGLAHGGEILLKQLGVKGVEQLFFEENLLAAALIFERQAEQERDVLILAVLAEGDNAVVVVVGQVGVEVFAVEPEVDLARVIGR